MKISADNIDYNTVRLIDAIIVDPYMDAERTDNDDNRRILMLGEIRGVLDMAKAMKEVLKA